MWTDGFSALYSRYNYCFNVPEKIKYSQPRV